MVLVDFTLAERWRVFGELSFAPVRKTAASKRTVAAPTDTAEATPPARSYACAIDPQESPARREAQAAFMQRML